MNLSRREFLRLTGIVAGAAAAVSCSPVYRELAGAPDGPVSWPDRTEPDFPALRRLTFGPTAAERRFVLDHGLQAWIEEQLASAQDEGRRLRWLLRGLDTLGREANELASLEKEVVLRDLRSATVLRKVYSKAQLRERMVEFWTDHFNIYVEKSGCWHLKPVDDRDVIRANAMGSFDEILWASAHSPAMLVYLDNQANNLEAPNENYARELMELHTLSVNGGYSQADVMELARCLTGWTVKDHFWKGEFTFDPERHDPGEKTVLERRIKPVGQGEAERILKILAQENSTAEHIARKLVQKFICDDPIRDAADLVERTAQALRRDNLSIKRALRVVLLDGLGGRAGSLPPKFKRPTDFVLSALRMLGAETDGGQSIQDHLAAMGQGLFAWPTPDGPPESAAHWQGNLLPRWQFAMDLAQGRVPGTELPLDAIGRLGNEGTPSLLHDLGNLLLGGPLPDEATVEIVEALLPLRTEDARLRREILVAGLLASPAFQWR